MEPIAKTRRVEIIRGLIDRDSSSLVAAMDAVGETIGLTMALADIFAGEIDFNNEVQPGDRFELLVEKQYRENEVFAGYGPILAAEFENGGRRVRAVRFTPDGGSPGYFDERGASMKRFFLKSPLKFDPVVTSGFSRNRLHPVLHEARAHLGVDYRAPVGAPVIAVADGTVASAGRSGGSASWCTCAIRTASKRCTCTYRRLPCELVRASARATSSVASARPGWPPGLISTTG